MAPTRLIQSRCCCLGWSQKTCPWLCILAGMDQQSAIVRLFGTWQSTWNCWPWNSGMASVALPTRGSMLWWNRASWGGDTVMQLLIAATVVASCGVKVQTRELWEIPPKHTYTAPVRPPKPLCHLLLISHLQVTLRSCQKTWSTHPQAAMRSPRVALPLALRGWPTGKQNSKQRVSLLLSPHPSQAGSSLRPL